MKKLRIAALLLCVAMLVSVVSVSAAGFPDVDNDQTVSWAKDSIDKMTNAGYIKGYEDGTFRPYRAITKIECLVLMARMLGYENDDYSDLIDEASKAYKATVLKYNTTYPNELSYLLYCGILKEADLVEYASAANANTQLLRYQAAMLMAKLLGADAEAKSFSTATPTYADNVAIPQAARPYVEYVTKNGIMNGMDKTEDGKAQFSPVTTLTRAQMATLLARMMDKMNINLAMGEVEEASSSYITVDGDDIKLATDTKVYYEDGTLSVGDINEGDYVLASVVADKAVVVYVMDRADEEAVEIYGVIDKVSESASGKKITIYDYEDEDTNETYTLKDNCKILVNGSIATFGDLKTGKFVKVTISGSKAAIIEVVTTTFEVNGYLVKTDFDNKNHVYFTLSDADGENEQTYVESIKGAKITRNGDEADIKELSAGDLVTLKLSYGKVTSVTAISHSESFTGLLKEIIISNEPAITVTVDGKDKKYKIRPDAKITVAGTASNIYGLRPNVTVNVTLDSDAVKTLSAATASTSEKGQIEGVVTGKNTSYKVITAEDSDGNIQSIYYNNNTKFLNSNGSSVSVKNIENGAKISVTGVENNGVFEATIIIIK